MDRDTAADLEQTDGIEDWRMLDSGASAWFDAPSMSAGAALVGRIAGLTAGSALPHADLRPDGVRVRIGSERDLTRADAELARSISSAARDLGLAADPAALQTMGIVIDTGDPAPVLSFWRTVLGYETAGVHRLVDPSRRSPGLTVHRSRHQSRHRTLRDRIHVDVVRPPDAVEAARAAVGQEPFGAHGVALVDADGNEVDVVPGDRLTPGRESADWQVVFGAMACYPVDSARQAAAMVSAVAGLADDAGLPLMVDVRTDGVTIDSGKDQWEDEEGSATNRFEALACRVQAVAHDLGLSADPARPRFVQLGMDAVDVPAVRAFWASVLGYAYDPRTSVTDIYDPRRLNPVLFFQQMEASDTERRQHRNRVHLELVVPPDQARGRIDAAVAAGGRIVAEIAPNRRTLVDPEGNEVDVVTSRQR
jgi:catechol 2,3-dioxygenase-like lactoylglutathione lyase family enzyme